MMQITHNEFKDANKRLQDTVTYSELFKALKKHFYTYFDGTHGKAVVDDIEKFLSEIAPQKPDKRLTAQWLSSALAGKDYNKYIAELKSEEKNTSEVPFSHFADKVDFELFDEAISDFILSRYKNNVLYSELEIWGTAVTIMNMLFGQTKWSNSVTFGLVYGNTASRVDEIKNKQKIYWIEEVVISTPDGDYHDYTIAYSYRAEQEAEHEPSEEEVETKDLEKLTQAEMKDRFAWNCRSNRPVTVFKNEFPHGDGKVVLIPND